MTTDGKKLNSRKREAAGGRCLKLFLKRQSTAGGSSGNWGVSELSGCIDLTGLVCRAAVVDVSIFPSANQCSAERGAALRQREGGNLSPGPLYAC